MLISKLYRLVWFATTLACAGDVLISQRGPYLNLAYQSNWGQTGPGGTDNNYLFTPLDPDQGMCLFISNNDTNSHSFSLAVYQTGDPNVNSYTTKAGRFAQNSIVGTISPVNAGQTTSAYIHSSAAAKVSVNISGSSGSGNADIYVVETSSGSCGPVVGGLQGIQGAQAAGTTMATNPLPAAGLTSGNIVTPLLVASNGTLQTSANFPTTQNVQGTQASGSTSTGNPLVMSGLTAGNVIVPLLVDSTGQLAITFTQSFLSPTCTTLSAVPTSLTQIVSGSHYIANVIASNTTSSAINLTLQDSSSNAYASALVINGNSTFLMSVPSSFQANSLYWLASTTGMMGEVCYF